MGWFVGGRVGQWLNGRASKQASEWLVVVHTAISRHVAISDNFEASGAKISDEIVEQWLVL